MKKIIYLLLCIPLFSVSGCFDGYSKSDTKGQKLINLLGLTFIQSEPTDLGAFDPVAPCTLDIAIAPLDDKPIIAVGSAVYKWEYNSTWTQLLTGGINFTSITIDPSDNKPLIVYSMNSSTPANIDKWNDRYNWDSLGSTSPGETNYATIVIDPIDNKPVVAFKDYTDIEYRLKVIKWSSGINWTDLGYASIGSATSISLVMGSDGKPIVSFCDHNDSLSRARVMKWSSGTSWTDLGFASDGNAESGGTSLAIDTSDGRPYLLFVNNTNSRAQIKKWSSGTTWTDLGFAGSGYPNTFGSHNIAIDTNNKPYVAYNDSLNQEKLVVFSWVSGTSWKQIAEINSGPLYTCSLAINSKNEVFVIFKDPEPSTLVRVVRLKNIFF